MIWRVCRRYDTSTPIVDPKHISTIVVPGGYNLSALNTTQVRSHGKTDDEQPHVAYSAHAAESFTFAF